MIIHSNQGERYLFPSYLIFKTSNSKYGEGYQDTIPLPTHVSYLLLYWTLYLQDSKLQTDKHLLLLSHIPPNLQTS